MSTHHHPKGHSRDRESVGIGFAVNDVGHRYGSDYYLGLDLVVDG
jgi:hypothetical protein